MKKVIRKGVLLLGILTSMASYANKVSYTSTTKEIKKTTLILNNIKKGHQLLIKDVNGVVLYKELIKDSGLYTKGFDLTSLPNGNYYFELDKDFEIKTIPFKVASSEVIFNKEEESIIFKPVVLMKDNLVLISRLSFNEKPLELKIYYADNNDLVYSEKIKEIPILERIYNFSNVKKGTYKIVIKTEGRIFIENINI